VTESLTHARPAPAEADAEGAAAAPGDESPDVFLSYSRTDGPAVLRIATALRDAGWRVWVDTEDIPPAAEWRDELAAGIRAAHTFVFVLSPDSAASDYCRWELEQAVALGKRLIPLVIRPVDDAPEALASRQYVLMREQDVFEDALERLTRALDTDLEWVRGHRQWLLAALRWDAQDRDRSLLLRGRELKAAEAWLARQADRTEPRPTQLQTEFLLASRAWETRRSQIVAGAVGAGLVVAIVLGIVALLQRNDARTQASIARSRELALSSTQQLPIDPERSLLLAGEAVSARATPEADNALRAAVLASRLRASVPLEAERVGGLVNAVAFSPDGKLVAAALKNGTVSVVDSTPRRGVRATVLPKAPLDGDDLCSSSTGAAGHIAVAFSPDSRLVAAVNETAWIHVWRRAQSRPVTSRFCLGKTTPADPFDIIGGLTGGVAPLALTITGDGVVAVVGHDGRVLRWRWASDAQPILEGRPRQGVLAAAFSADARLTALVDGAGLGVIGGRSAASLPARDLYAVAISADGGTVAGAGGRRVVVWTPGGAAAPRTLTAPTTVRAVALSPDGGTVAVGDGERAVRVWDLARDRPPVVLQGSQGAVTALAFSPDGRRIVTGGDDGVLRVWEWDASRPLSLRGAARGATRFELTHDGRLLALDPDVAGAGWIATAGGLRRIEGVRSPAYVSVSRDGRRAAAPVAPLGSGAVQVWELDRGAQPRATEVEGFVNNVAVSPDGRWIAFAGRRFQVAAWPGGSPRALGPSGRVRYSTAAFAPDSGRVAAAAYDGKRTRISVWPLTPGGGVPDRTFSALGYTADLAFSRDGTRLVAAQSDGGVWIWELDGDAAPTVLRGHPDGVNAAAFSSDGTEVVSGGSDGTVRVWRIEGAKSVALPGPGGHAVAVAFTPDGAGVVAVGTQGSRMWPCDFCGSTKRVESTAERIATRALTADERAVFLHER
jgi:WD40 repeat protein